VTADDIRAVRARLGLTIGAGARLVGVQTRTWERWEQGVRAIPAAVQRLLWAVERDPSLLQALHELAAQPVGREVGCFRPG
jgi:DNA-binding transcriptional regulator YiaG